MRYPEHLLKLISVLKKLPGVGSKSAERFAFHLIDWPQERLDEMSQTLLGISEKLKYCFTCGALNGDLACPFCAPDRLDYGKLCIVSSSKDLFSIEDTREYKGTYHVLGGLLSPLQEQTPLLQALTKIKERIAASKIEEVIIALDSTLEGDATALFIKRDLDALKTVHTTRLALGLPMGSSLDLIDGGTLARALAFRRTY